MIFPHARNTCLAILVCLTAYGCSDATESVIPGPKLLFFSDFEEPTDSIGWEGSGTIALYNDSLNTRGSKCLMVRGPEVLGHARRLIDSLVEPGDIIIRFKARNLGGREGSIVLASGDVLWDTWVEVSDTVWKYYADTSMPRTGNILGLELWIQGDMQLDTPVLVDNVEVSWVRNQ